MSPDTRPTPVPDRFTAAFWTATEGHALHVQFCGRCMLYQHPPGPLCRKCHREEHLTFESVSGQGTVYSFTVTFNSVVPGFEREAELIVGLIELDEQAGVRLVANLRGVEIDQISVGMPVEVVFEDRENGGTLPQFQPVRLS